eukprot:TRINITY_DN521_c0_g1_i3.p1 TRINITY_DN521_c0_g1~~TRINITY_DN521_c0_g1_i3.p1  ORF type:complete len:262 (-),score=17.32 TRINITY_DN521_c0_g1_i3:253-1038(-)
MDGHSVPFSGASSPPFTPEQMYLVEMLCAPGEATSLPWSQSLSWDGDTEQEFSGGSCLDQFPDCPEFDAAELLALLHPPELEQQGGEKQSEQFCEEFLSDVDHSGTSYEQPPTPSSLRACQPRPVLNPCANRQTLTGELQKATQRMKQGDDRGANSPASVGTGAPKPTHAESERQRRETHKKSYTAIRKLLPPFKKKGNAATIQHAVNFIMQYRKEIEDLEREIRTLERKKRASNSSISVLENCTTRLGNASASASASAGR